ncbi:methyltransferase family protein [Acidicapsa dinghuensis]|uniref:Methyltransferase family protein n=1 Tax=Acidicapsa dinghuensis TaxID=2218256 RepID=A0ABW1EHN7_9BACT|nr:isoprenylcysteine carboxylmethyltransferase family protein [Acidicapsa dinghuensis]
MKATHLEFRLRLWISVAILFLGFWAPWIEWFQLGSRTTAWLWLGFQLSRIGIPASSAIQVATAIAIAAAAIAVVLRVWASAYLGHSVVTNSEMKAGAVMADGPFRHVRNPLYIGSMLMNVAIVMLMPPSGALVALVLIGLFVLRLIFGEEAFLSAQLGQPYLDYCKAVPRLFPALRSRVPKGGQRPQWVRAALSELTPIGVLVSFAALSWQYNAQLLIRAVLISFGVSLVVRAMMTSANTPAQPVA